MQPQTIEDIRNYFIEHDLFNKYNLTKIGVFGSFARGEKFNDIDLYVEDEVNLLKLYYLKKILQYEWNIKVDIVPKKEADPLIMYFAINDMKYIYK
ncbi:MAG TPA: nucleotidyltransferase domain-containing protein [Chitinophagales bacterium]|jgi:predicted nucleotidyltransferase|nr:nucleotidyltransferase domain-containing protein [Chitinophagales bacterium]MBP6155206.1 nucleotidyltransferase domain-containing protein [Chitinophagales bacterium]HQW78725.1 nucleotidyltransferase domain-containing protein [Chitinophagales bacterium]HRB92839.1 nucleotidyltransferase domain-containing protein [Chitinophagales bacterium]